MFRFLYLVPCFLVIPANAAEWPQWRGPQGQGHAPTAKDLPNQWKVGPAGKHVAGQMFDDVGDRVALAIKNSGEVFVRYLCHGALGQLLVVVEELGGVLEMRGSKFESHDFSLGKAPRAKQDEGGEEKAERHCADRVAQRGAIADPAEQGR